MHTSHEQISQSQSQPVCDAIKNSKKEITQIGSRQIIIVSIQKFEFIFVVISKIEYIQEYEKNVKNDIFR